MPEIQKPVIMEANPDCNAEGKAKHFEPGWQWNWVAGMSNGAPVLVMVCSECGVNCSFVPVVLLKTSGNNDTESNGSETDNR